MDWVAALKKPQLDPPAAPLKLDFGCGPHPREGFTGVDRIAFGDMVTHVVDLRVAPWPWADHSVSEAHSSHFVEHLTAVERVTFFNELWRVLIPNGTCQIITPHWASCRAYGDPTHQWPPVSEFSMYYLSRDWRQANAPHTDRQHWPDGYACHFEATWGYTLRPDLGVRSVEWQQFAVANYKETILDLCATLTARI
jgi:hypothetical protein